MDKACGCISWPVFQFSSAQDNTPLAKWILSLFGGASSTSYSFAGGEASTSRERGTELDIIAIERKWASSWEKDRVFQTEPDESKPPFFITVAYPYPNSPQHVGHGRTYGLTDVYARYMRMRGYNVLFPMAFHYTGTPILAMARRLKEGDKDLQSDFLEIYKVPESKLQGLAEPLSMAQYFHEEIRRGMKEIGYSIDWRREFTTIDPGYKNFITWQFNRLRSLGRIIVGSHPVGWCPRDENPVGQHDTRGDVEPEIGEFVLIKFPLEDGYYFPTATLRCETIFGVTNLWLNPDAEYVRAKVRGEKWITSAASVQKLRLQNKDVQVEDSFRGSKLVGNKATNPMTGKNIIVLPGKFVDPKNATGNVMSVPGHAPYDYVALEEMKKNPTLIQQFGLSEESISGISPISLIEAEGFGDLPAVEAVSRRGITGQEDPQLEDATKEVYLKEFHSGIMKPITGKYSGKRVPEARTEIRQDMISQGKAEAIHEIINRPVYCRCGSECTVKIFSDQYFIDYGREDWKKLATECLREMRIVPNEIRDEFFNVVGWLREKACARKSGLGTQLPWDREWIIESLSDSTIYMCYYIFAKYLNLGLIQADNLKDEVFEYVLLGNGDVDTIAKRVATPASVLKDARRDFLYFYPLASRHSGRDLVWNHLTYFVFNHVAIFPRNLWPKQIVVNGSVLMAGRKMSKSLGNIIPLREAINDFGSDALRLAIFSAAKLLQDAIFSEELAMSMRRWIERFHSEAIKVIAGSDASAAVPVDSIEGQWLVSEANIWVRAATKAMDELDFHEALNIIMRKMEDDVKWYIRRSSSREASQKEVNSLLRKILNVRLRLLSPFAPFICEEIWQKSGNEGYISRASWPEYVEGQVDYRTLASEEIVMKTLEDVQNVVHVLKFKPSTLYIYTPAKWKWDLFINGADYKQQKIEKDAITKKLLNQYALVVKPGDTKVVSEILDEISKTSAEELMEAKKAGRLDDTEILSRASSFLEKELGLRVKVFAEESINLHDPKKRASQARPYRPAIFLE